MKKKILIGIIAVLLIGVIIFALLPRISVNETMGGKVTFRYGWTDIDAVMEVEDAQKIATVLDGKRTHSDIYLNGFSDDVSFSLDGLTFCPARDMTPILYVWEKDRYITLSNEEMNTIRAILESYGFTFPCP